MNDQSTKFVSEDDLQTFEGWLTYQGVDPSTLTAEQLEMWREIYDDVRQRADATPQNRQDEA
jgi:hypothetical protein